MQDQCFNCRHHNSLKGNILFLILIAVALFAALSYAITSTSRSNGGEKLSFDKLKLSTAQIQQYGAQIEQAIQRVILINSCNISQVSFEPPPFSNSGSYYNSNAPSDFRCHIFHMSGGAVPYMGAAEFYHVALLMFDASKPVNQIGSTCSDASCSEIRMEMRLNTNADSDARKESAHLFCEQFNKAVQSDVKLGNIIYGDTGHPFDGTFGYDQIFGTGTHASVSGNDVFCVRAGTSIYSINYVLYTQ